MKISCESFGRIKDGRVAALYTIENESGASVQLTNFGAAIVSINVPNQNDEMVDVVLGCNCAADYEAQTACVGCVPGRHANRIGKGQFELDGQLYHLYINNGENHLHGGKVGFDKKLWSHSIVGDCVVFSYFSADGEEGYPGNLVVSVSYSFDEKNQLVIHYRALCDADTVINLTNHSYFNLDGQGNGTICNQFLKLNCDAFTENNNQTLPTGKILPVEGTPMDFRSFKEIGKDIAEPYEQLTFCGGYDHNFILRTQDGSITECAQAYSSKTGIQLTCYTNQPGVQLYTGNFLQDGNIHGKNGKSYGQYSGFCLETQHYPNAMEHEHFPSVVLPAGALYEYDTIFSFSIHS